MPDQHNVVLKGGTMRLGKYPCNLQAGSKAHKAYGKVEISERHRHRYEVNNEFRDTLAKKGLIFSGLSPDGRLVEMIELTDHPYYVACQFHPELKSRPDNAHPLFVGLVDAALKRSSHSNADGAAAKGQSSLIQKGHPMAGQHN